MNSQYKYLAFISYKREDEKWAKWLQYNLEHYKLPISVRKLDPTLPDRVRPIFKDTTDLAGGVLEKAIKDALYTSKYLIVICSPRAAQSVWVCKEVQEFIDSGREEYIIPFIIDGEPNSSNISTECFPQNLRDLSGDRELLGININEMGRDAAAIKVVARIFGLQFDVLWRRWEREKKSRNLVIIISILTLLFISFGVILFLNKQNRIIRESEALIHEQNDSLKSQKAALIYTLGELETSENHLKETNNNLVKAHNNLEVTNNKLESAYDELKNAFWKELKTKARYISSAAAQFLESDSYLVRLLALEILPKDIERPDKPYLPEAEYLLRAAVVRDNAIFRGHTSYVEHVLFSPDGSQLASSDEEGTIRFWNVGTGQQMYAPLKHIYGVSSFAYHPNGRYIVTASYDGFIRIWDNVTAEHLYSLYTGHTKDIYDVRLTDDGSKIITISQDGTIKVWEVESYKIKSEPINVLSFENQDFGFCDVSNDAKYALLLSPTRESAIVIDIQTGKTIISPFGIKGKRIRYLDFNPDHKYVAMALEDHTIRIWDTATGTQIGEPLIGHQSEIDNVFFSQDGKYILSSSHEDQTTRLWDRFSGKQISLLNKFIGVDNCLSPDARYIVTVDGTEEHFRIIELDTPRYQTESWGKGWEVDSKYSDAFFISNNELMVRAGNSSAIMCVQTGNVINGFSLESAYFNPDLTKALCLAPPDYSAFWITDVSGENALFHQVHNEIVTSVSYSTDGNYIVTASYDGTICIWNTNSGVQIGEPLIGHTDAVNSASFSTDGKYIVSASHDKTIRVWDVNSGLQVGEPLIGHKEWVNSASFSSDGKYIVSASRDKTIRIWDVSSGLQVGEPLIGHTDAVNSASFSTDGKYIVSASDDKTIRVWDVNSGMQVCPPIEIHNGKINTASFSPDRKYIVSTSTDKTVKLLKFPDLQELIDQTREQFNDRTLTLDERILFFLE